MTEQQARKVVRRLELRSSRRPTGDEGVEAYWVELWFDDEKLSETEVYRDPLP